MRRCARHFRLGFLLRFVFCFFRGRIGRSGVGGLLGRRLIALDQILRHAGVRARHAVGEYWLPVAFQLALGVERIVGEQRRRIELSAGRAAREREHKRGRRTGPNQQRWASRRGHAQPLPLAAISSLKTSARLRAAPGASIRRLACNLPLRSKANSPAPWPPMQNQLFAATGAR